jgi:hypothetical protein
MTTTPDGTTSGSSGANDLGQLISRLDELQRRSDALTAALDRSRQIRRLIMVAFLAFVLLAGWRFYALANTIRSKDYQDRLTAALQKSVATNQDTFSKEAQRLVDGITPVVTTAFADQSKKDLPLFMQVIDKERQALMDGLPQRMSDHVEKHHHAMLRRHEKLIQTEFPTVQNAEVRDRMMANVCTALDRLIKKYYVDEFQKEFLKMSNSWNDFPPAAAPGVGDPPLEEQLMGEMMDLVAVKMARHRSMPSK